MQRKLDLRTGRPVWYAYRAPRVPVAKLARDVRAEVLVIGMGISGAMIAEALARRGHDVVMVDRRGPVQGSTAATTALVQFEIDEPLSLLSRKVGRQKAEQAWRRSRLAVMTLRARIVESGIRCQTQLVPSLYLAGNVLDSGGLRDEEAARRQAGIHCTFLTNPDLKERFGIDRKAALLSHDNLTLDPRKLAAGLLLKAVERGAKLYAPCEAVSVHHHRDEVIVPTRNGPNIRARHVVLATGYELLDGVPSARHRIISTWAIATRPQPRALWPEQATIWEASDPYLYMRQTPDGRVICGGEDEDFSDEHRRDALIPTKTQRIAEKLARLFQHINPTPEFAWAGAFGTTSTGLPYIGTIPGKPRVFAVMGYGGNGITYSQIASEIVSTALDGRHDSDAALFALD